MTLFRHVACVVIALLFVGAAQRREEPAASGDSALCAAAVQKASGPQRDVETFRQLRLCPETAPALLAAAWMQLPSDDAQFQQLLASSAHLRDGRILQAVMEVSEDRSRSLRDRAGAWAVLLEYIEPPGSSHSLTTGRDGYRFVRRLMTNRRAGLLPSAGIAPSQTPRAESSAKRPRSTTSACVM
ncbi:MAG: hypothetical protein V4617_01965 [Gemmatimonadota bacterium]